MKKFFCTLLDAFSENKNLADETLFKNIELSILKMISDKPIGSTASGKMNLLFTDGEKLFEFCNHEKTLYKAEKNGSVIFSTEPLDSKYKLNWKHVELGAFNVYKNGELIFNKKILNDKDIIRVKESKDYSYEVPNF